LFCDRAQFLDQTIVNVFKISVDQIYQATEGFLGVSCRYGAIHLNKDSIIVEKQWLDRSTRRFVPVITDFVRTTQPLIRYRLYDVLIEREDQCRCGSIFTAIEKIEGREDDILFIFIEAKDGKIYVLECNPCATSGMHLAD
jgi:putative adenylate-forming enzyme